MTKRNASLPVVFGLNHWLRRENSWRGGQTVDMAIASGRLTAHYIAHHAGHTEQEKRILKRELAGSENTLTPLEITVFRYNDIAARSAQRSGNDIYQPQSDQWHSRFKGTGKSYLLETVILELERQGYNVVLLAPYGDQRKLLVKDGLDAKPLRHGLTI